MGAQMPEEGIARTNVRGAKRIAVYVACLLVAAGAFGLKFYFEEKRRKAQNLFFLECEEGCVFGVARALRAYPEAVSWKTSGGMTGCRIAAWIGDEECAMLLVRNGAEPDIFHGCGLAIPGSVSFFLNDNPAAVSSVDSRNRRRTPLHYAVKANSPEVIEILLAAGADINARADSWMTPLHLASQLGKRAAARVLVAHRADPDAKSHTARTPLHLAAEAGQSEVIAMLLDAGADVNAVGDGSCGTPLHEAIRGKHANAAKTLIAAGADLGFSNPKVEPPLVVAFWAENLEVFRFLLEAGADPRATTSEGVALLALCKKREKPEMAEMLAQYLDAERDGSDP